MSETQVDSSVYKIIEMIRKLLMLWVVILLMVASQALGSATVEWEVLKTIELEAPPLDVAISPDGTAVFVLTDKGNIYIYEVNGRLTDKIEVGETIDQIKLDPQGKLLFATNRQNKTVKVIELDFIKQITTKGSPYKGLEDAPVVIADFSDFQ
jgi:DNA-binding beta-propeller fold protein YncE